MLQKPVDVCIKRCTKQAEDIVQIVQKVQTLLNFELWRRYFWKRYFWKRYLGINN